MTDEEFLKLARECGADMSDVTALFCQGDLIDYCRDIERRTLERAAVKCDEKAKRNFPWASENSDLYHAQADGAERCAKAIRAMIEEKE